MLNLVLRPEVAVIVKIAIEIVGFLGSVVTIALFVRWLLKRYKREILEEYRKEMDLLATRQNIMICFLEKEHPTKFQMPFFSGTYREIFDPHCNISNTKYYPEGK